jgi:hypothetical protein
LGHAVAHGPIDGDCLLRNIPGWHEVDWDHVERMRVEFPPLAHKHLTADSIEPLEDNVRKVLGNTRRWRMTSH